MLSRDVLRATFRRRLAGCMMLNVIFALVALEALATVEEGEAPAMPGEGEEVFHGTWREGIPYSGKGSWRSKHMKVLEGEWEDGERLHYAVKGKYDPGYGSTSRMLAETGMGLLESDAEGGVGTPGSFLGEALVTRLQERAELTFAVEQ